MSDHVEQATDVKDLSMGSRRAPGNTETESAAARSQMCDKVLVSLSVVAIPALAASLYRAFDIGWQPVMTSHVVAAGLLGVITLLRRRIPYGARAGFLVGLAFVLGTAAEANVGLLSTGVLFIATAIISAYLLLGAAWAIGVSALALGMHFTVYALFTTGRLTLAVDPTVYLGYFSSWVTPVAAVAFTVSWIGSLVISAIRDAERSKDLLHDAIEGIMHSVTVYDENDKLVVRSESFVERYRGTADAVTQIGSDFRDFARTLVERRLALNPPGPGNEELIAKLVANHRRADGVPKIQTLADGRVFEVTKRRTRHGGIVTIAMDVTARVNIERREREAQKMEALGRLTGGMAHDFNNFLGVIIANLDLLATRVKADAVATNIVDVMLRASLGGAELIKSLLAFARNQPLAPEFADLGDSLRKAVSMLARTLGKEIAITLSTDPDLWSVRVDRAQLKSCILNLANNARDAMRGAGHLKISARNITLGETVTAAGPDLAPGEYVLIEVADTGEGMTPEVAARAFEPFFTTKEHRQGTGLGLSMVRGFIEQSGGYICLLSKVDRGTTVQIYLPRAIEARLSDGASAGTTDVRLPGGAETILVVEDNLEMRKIIVTQLASLGYRTLEAEDGAMAQAVLQDPENRVDLLFSDIVMPGIINGYELAARARAAKPDLKILLTSGYPGSRPTSDTADLEDLTLLPKPYRMSELAGAIRTALAKKP